MHNELGKTLAFAGIVLMLNQAAAIMGNFLGGFLFDRFSPYKTILLGTGTAFTAALTLSMNHSIVPYTILLIVIGFGSGITIPVMFAMAGSVWPEGGRKTFNAIYVAQNLGVALGASIGGYVASISFDYIFMANAFMFGMFFLLVLTTYKGMDEEKNRSMSTSILEQTSQIKSKAAFNGLLILSGGFLIAWIAYSQWQSTIASYTQDIGIPLEQYSALWAINGFLIVLGQPLVSFITKRITSQKMHIYIGTIIMILSFVVASFAEMFTMFAGAMIILTLGEMLIFPAIPSLANELAPKGRTGFYQGFVNSVAAAGRMTGPFLGGLIVDLYHINLLFIVLIFLLVIPFMTTYLYDRGVKKSGSIIANK